MRRKGEITHNSFFLPFLFFVDFFSFLFLRTRHERKDLSPFAFGGVTMSSSSAVKLGDFSIFFSIFHFGAGGDFIKPHTIFAAVFTSCKFVSVERKTLPETRIDRSRQ